MATNFREAVQLFCSYLRDFVAAGYRLVHLIIFDLGSPFLKYMGPIIAIFLLILDDSTYWRTNTFTSLLIPYIFITLPSWVFYIFREEFGKWIALIIVFRFLLPKRFPDCQKYPAALILLIVVAPDLFANTLRSSV